MIRYNISQNSTMTNCTCASNVNTSVEPVDPIKIVSTSDYPYSADCFDKYPDDCEFGGLEIEYIYTVITRMMHLPIEWIKVDDYETMDSYVTEGKADLMGIAYVLEPELFPNWKYSPIYLYDGVALIVKENLVDGQNNGLLSVFHWNLWMMMLLVTVIVTIYTMFASMSHNTCYNMV